MLCLPNIGELPSYFGGSHVIEHQSPPTTGTKGASGGSGMSTDKQRAILRIQETNLQFSTLSFDLIVVVFFRSLTHNLDFDTGCVFTRLILQDYLVVACVLPLCDFNCQAGLVAVCFSSDTMAGLKNHLRQTGQIICKS